MNIEYVGSTLTLGDCAVGDKIHPHVDMLTKQEQDDFAIMPSEYDGGYKGALRNSDVVWEVGKPQGTNSWNGTEYETQDILYSEHIVELPIHTPVTKL